jgi:hypothetical protein
MKKQKLFKLFNIYILTYFSDFLKNYCKPRITAISIISVYLLVQCSPILSLLWLSISTFYFLYVREYRDIYKIWGFTISIWYIIFTTSLSQITIIVGFSNTKVILNYLLDNSFIFENLCFQTVYMLDALSTTLGFSIYIPTVVNIFSFISKLFKNGKN